MIEECPTFFKSGGNAREIYVWMEEGAYKMLTLSLAVKNVDLNAW